MKLKSRAIEEKDFELILETDKKVYPTNSPVTREIIRAWYNKNPEFGVIFEDDKGKIIGDFIVIPLNEVGWNKLVSGELKEADMNYETIFDNSRDKKIGLHGYHIEKFDKTISNFNKMAFEELGKIIESFRKNNRELKVVGFSALAVTSEGINLAEKFHKFKEREFIIDEHILEKDGKKFVAESLEEAEKKKKEGYVYLNRCKMLVLYPEDRSIVWDYIK